MDDAFKQSLFKLADETKKEIFIVVLADILKEQGSEQPYATLVNWLVQCGKTHWKRRSRRCS